MIKRDETATPWVYRWTAEEAVYWWLWVLWSK